MTSLRKDFRSEGDLDHGHLNPDPKLSMITTLEYLILHNRVADSDPGVLLGSGSGFQNVLGFGSG